MSKKIIIKTGILLMLICISAGFIWLRAGAGKPQKAESAPAAASRKTAGTEDGERALKAGNSEIIISSKKIRSGTILSKGQELAEFALSCEGCKYLYGGKSPETGFDCSGLVYYVYDRFGYRVNRIACDQAKQGTEVGPDELQPGDVLCFYTSPNYIGHVGIYLGEGLYVHAMGRAYGVVKSSLDDPYMQRKFVARRFLGCPELMKETAYSEEYEKAEKPPQYERSRPQNVQQK